MLNACVTLQGPESHHTAFAQGGIAEELSAALQAGAPSFFREDDKTFYRASALLQRAAETFPGPDSGQLASQVSAFYRPALSAKKC